MFYSAQILSKKGPLGTCWLASWSQRGLKRNEVFATSLPAAADSIINPEAPLALRLSGQLLLGLVRLYLRKLQFLEEDAGQALRGLARNATAGQGTQVDLPDGGVAPEMAITLQDTGYDPMAAFVGNELFPSFESSMFGEGSEGGGLGLGGGGASLTVAQDISELFGSRWTAPEGEEGDAAMERRFSTELERLRSQGVEAPRDRADMFFGGGAEEAFSPVVMMEDEVMAVPPEDLFAGTPLVPPGGKTPLSAGAAAAPLPGLSDMRITPPSLPGGGVDDLLPDVGGLDEGGASGPVPSHGADLADAGGYSLGYDEAPLPLAMEMEAMDAAEEAAAAAAAAGGGARRTPQRRRRKATVDVGRDGRPATTLSSDEIRKLLADRKPLMVARGQRPRRGAPPPPSCFDVAVQAEASRDVAVQELLRPSAFPALAPELLQLYNSALTLGDAARAAGTPGSAWRRRSSRGAAADEEEAAAAAAVEAVAAEQEAGGASPGGRLSLASAGGASDFGPMSAGGGFDGQYGEEDWIEPADTQQEQQLQAEAAALFPASEEELGGAEGASAAERRGRVPLQAVPYGSEEPAELGSIGPNSADGGAASSGSGAAAQQATSFTKNTALVLEHLHREFAPATGSKRRHPSHGELAAGMASLSLDSMLLGGGAPRGRLDAARWFYESLVLRNTGFVTLRQEQPYGDIAIAPTQLMMGAGDTPPAPPAP